jgi:uncharacterized iron-regulated membrane protein
MKGQFRHSMAWLHTWCGLTCGWLLCAIFLTGTLSVFRDPITRWMEAQPVAAVEAPGSADAGSTAALHAERYLREHASGARFWRIQLPEHPGEATRLVWRLASGTRQVALDPVTGAVLPQDQVRNTEGGRHFMWFHYMLHLPVLGFWLVGWLTLGMLVALVSGVVVHRRIFLDFFTFRPGTGPRAWLDAHNATAVITLPFQLMIAYTGLAIFYNSYMPGPMQAVYGSDSTAYNRFQPELAAGDTTSGNRPALNEQPIFPPELSALMLKAKILTGQPAHMLLIDKPDSPDMTLRVIGRADDAQPSATLFNPQTSVLFNGVTGETMQVQGPTPETRSSGEQIYGVFKSLHVVGFGGWGMKWLYFAFGLLGMAMMATGTLLFSLKRRIKSQREFDDATRGMYRCIEAFNVTCVAGIAVACIAYLHANRLLPIEMPDRALWEIRSFLLIWLTTLIHALCRPVANAWTEQMLFAALLCFCLPLVNFCTTGQHLGLYMAVGDWQRASVEGVALAFGAVLVIALLKLRARQADKKRSSREQPVSHLP